MRRLGGSEQNRLGVGGGPEGSRVDGRWGTESAESTVS